MGENGVPLNDYFNIVGGSKLSFFVKKNGPWYTVIIFLRGNCGESVVGIFRELDSSF